MKSNTRLLKALTNMFNVLECNGLADDSTRKEYDDICNNYHDVLLSELDSVTTESSEDE